LAQTRAVDQHHPKNSGEEWGSTILRIQRGEVTSTLLRIERGEVTSTILRIERGRRATPTVGGADPRRRSIQ
jgi:hypothetical protein